MRHRPLAVLGSIQYGIRQFVGALLSFVGLSGLARFAVPLLVAVLATAAVISARNTAAILAARPEVQETTLAEVASSVDESGSVWFAFDALMGATHLLTPADLGTFFYLARDPAEPSTGLLVRSSLNDAFIRQRVLTARLLEDEAQVAAALEGLAPLPGSFDLDRTRLLEEVASGGNAERAVRPSRIGDEPDGAELIVTGRMVTPISHVACAVDDCAGEDAAWYYYLADPEGGTAFVLRSPHPPDAIPVRLEGLYLRDSYDLGPVLESDWYAGLGARVPAERAFSAGSRPPIVDEASWVPAIVYALPALILLASLLAGYPVFQVLGRPEPARRLATGEGIELEITGRLARERATLTLDRTPGTVERLSLRELAVRMWRYGLLPRELSRREAEERFLAETTGAPDRLVIHERDQSTLIEIERSPAAVSVEVGRLYRLAGAAPAVRVRQGATNAYLTLRTTEDRDRVASEIRGEVEARPADA